MRGRRQDGATVLVFRDRETGEEFDGGLEDAERLRRMRRIAEERAEAEASLRHTAEERAIHAEERARAAEGRAQEEAGLKRAAEARVRALEKRIWKLTARVGGEASD